MEPSYELRMAAAVVSLQLVVGIPIGAILLRASIAFHNRLAGDRASTLAIPNPPFGRSLQIMLAINLASIAVGFVVNLVANVGATTDGSPIRLGAAVVATVISVLAAQSILSAMLPTSMPRALLLLLCYPLAALLIIMVCSVIGLSDDPLIAFAMVALPLPIAIGVGSLVLRAAIAFHNKRARGGTSENAIPEPTLGRAAFIIFAVYLTTYETILVEGVIASARATPPSAGVILIAFLTAVVVSLNISQIILSFALPTSRRRALPLTLCVVATFFAVGMSVTTIAWALAIDGQ